MIKRLSVIVLLLVLQENPCHGSAGFFGSRSGGLAGDWNYDDQDSWGGSCHGRSQSPIDLPDICYPNRYERVVIDRSLTITLQGLDDLMTGKLTNNGHSVSFTIASPSVSVGNGGNGYQPGRPGYGSGQGSGSNNNGYQPGRPGYGSGSGSSSNNGHGSGSNNNGHQPGRPGYGSGQGSGSSNNGYQPGRPEYGSGSGSSNNNGHQPGRPGYGSGQGSGSSNNGYQPGRPGYGSGSGSSNNNGHQPGRPGYGSGQGSGSSNNGYQPNRPGPANGYETGNQGSAYQPNRPEYQPNRPEYQPNRPQYQSNRPEYQSSRPVYPGSSIRGDVSNDTSNSRPTSRARLSGIQEETSSMGKGSAPSLSANFFDKLRGSYLGNSTSPLYSESPRSTNRYDFSEIHFHWNHRDTKGSEHSVAGSRKALEMHLVHYNSRYGNKEEAAKHNDGLVVLAVLFHEDTQENPRLKSITDNLSRVKRVDSSTPISRLSVRSLLPDDYQTFYTYAGSLTTPPCSEVVSWIIVAQTQKLGYNQLKMFQDLQSSGTQSDRRRDIQPLNGRTVFASSNDHCRATSGGNGYGNNNGYQTESSSNGNGNYPSYHTTTRRPGYGQSNNNGWSG